jgi:uncharacterized protein
VIRQYTGLLFSPTDLNNFLDSEFGSWMDRYYVERKYRERADAGSVDGNSWSSPFLQTCQPDEIDEESKLVRRKGDEHEKRFLEKLKSEGKKVAEIPGNDQKAALTCKAMAEAIPVIYQAYLTADNFAGYADFLVRQDGPSKLGKHHYEVWDTKLAKSAKPYFILQLCAYAEMLEKQQGVRPKGVEVVLGNGRQHRFETNRFFYYYRKFKAAFLEYQRLFDGTKMPHPGLGSSYGRWGALAAEILEKADHLCRVARCTRLQIRKLEAAGIDSMAKLAASTAPSVSGLDAQMFARLKRQAKLQVDSAGCDTPLFAITPPTADDPRRGLALLPPASQADVFFDMEGYPLIDGGLEYLFGAVYQKARKPAFIDWWAHDDLEEKKAFEGFIDWVHARWKSDRSMHIYHYADYEVAAMRRLMGKYATREVEVDELLRNEVFIDLYKIVRQGLLIGTPSYSLKEVEHLYMPKRDGAIATAGGSIVAYQKWMDSGEPGDWQSSPILADIRSYNEVDCDSTRLLAEWLRKQQKKSGIAYLPDERETSVPQATGAAAPKVNRSKELAERLLAELEQGAVTDPERRRVQELLAWLLEFHWREAKPVFWRMFDRHEMTEDQLVDDFDCLGGLQRTARPRQPIRRSFLYQYRFDPDQDTKMGEGSKCMFAHDLAAKTTIESFDADKGFVELKLGAQQPPPPKRLSLIPDEYVSAKAISDAVFAYVSAWATGKSASSAVDDLLARRRPRIKGCKSGSILPNGADVLKSLPDAVRRMQGTTLCIQGPPGSGKTHTSAHVIVELLADGKRIGVMANSHKAIMNLIAKVAELADERPKLKHVLIKVGGDDDDPLIASGRVGYLDSSSDAADAMNVGKAGLVMGGSAWLFSRPELRGQFDYLFVDEAGQVSLANLVAAGQAASNLILVGDQMQLGQPIQGSHPGESGKSGLDYLLDRHATIPPDLGVFLGVTWRMHPDICRFISDAVYEGRLNAVKETSVQAVLCKSKEGRITRKTGVVFVPVDHQDNTQCSDEEVEVIREIVAELLGRCFVDREGKKRDLTLADILIVAPYNMQVRRLKNRLGPQARVGSVDKFQGQEAPVVIVSMCASSVDDCPRGVDFLLNKNRINVAVSRAQCLSIVVGSPTLMTARCKTVEHMELLNLYCWLATYAEELPA